MRKPIILFFTALFFVLPGKSQLTRYIIELTNKAENTYTLSAPWEFLSARALERRTRFNIALDSTDLPVTPRYLDSIRLAGNVSILNSSKWLNQVAIQTTDDAALAKINSFPFVKNFRAIAPRTASSTSPLNKFETGSTPAGSLSSESLQIDLTNLYNYGQSYGQVHLHQGEFLHNHGFSGQGMQLAMLDAGFPNYPTLATFDSARINNQFLGTWDFVTNNSNVNGANFHGTLCLSTIAANVPGSFVGTAPKTSFYLFRTEDAATEYPIEEQNFAAGLEKADSLGVELASVSLGYYTFDNPAFNYTYQDMNGDKTISARAADWAARKGMLVVVANGNEGSSSWHYLITPADADSVLSVGAVNTAGTVAPFSSYGPSSDGRVKPGVAAVGWGAVANAGSGSPGFYNGTSLACPNMAGLATSLWQAFPEEKNMGIISALQQSATRASTPDDRMGYGIPDMKKAFVILLKRFYTQKIQQAGCNATINFTAKSSSKMNFEVQRKLPTDADYVTVQTQLGSGNFASGTFSYNDDLASFSSPISISYRIKMNIDTDTSFFFDPVTINHANNCITYTFIGNGQWTDPSNWDAGLIPPVVLPGGSTIVINPVVNGECILNTHQQVLAGGYFTVLPGKRLFIPGNLSIQQ